jgi:hypothetical protein
MTELLCDQCSTNLEASEALELETGETVCGACETKYLINNYK